MLRCVRALSRKAIFIFGSAVLSFALAGATARASCETTDLLKFALTNAQSNFSAIRGGNRPGTHQYNLKAAAERFCPNVFILEDHPASDKTPEIWVLYFDVSADRASESNDQIAADVIKQLSPVLKSKGYRYTRAQRDDSGIELLWTGPSKTYVWVSTYAANVSSPDAGFKIQVEHYVK